ncbi:hypothetical protein DNTS_001933 [Danionella cerebrum]|uniref:Uncharacterized protein n=1 Tax=Danionella cerebrum TaxID=2873325 RepID=A0A553PVA3_9TELE|nr:hypothetical protein DNTS_001933 [Danionella translucida]
MVNCAAFIFCFSLSEAEVDIRELKDSSQKDGLNADVSRDTPVGLSPPEMLSKQVAEDQQILDLKGKLQSTV